MTALSVCLSNRQMVIELARQFQVALVALGPECQVYKVPTVDLHNSNSSNQVDTYLILNLKFKKI